MFLVNITPQISRRSFSLLCLFVLSSFLFLLPVGAADENQLSVYIYKFSTCDTCMSRIKAYVNPFMKNHLEEAEWISRDLFTNSSFKDELVAFIGEEAANNSELPVVVFVLGNQTLFLPGQDVSIETLEETWLHFYPTENQTSTQITSTLIISNETSILTSTNTSSATTPGWSVLMLLPTFLGVLLLRQHKKKSF